MLHSSPLARVCICTNHVLPLRKSVDIPVARSHSRVNADLLS